MIDPDEIKNWQELAEPFGEKCKEAVRLGQDLRLDRTEAAKLGMVLACMAGTLDGIGMTLAKATVLANALAGAKSPAPVKPDAPPEPAKPKGPTRAESQAHARKMGYTGEMCSECHSFAMVRAGTCLRCEACGTTTGCS